MTLAHPMDLLWGLIAAAVIALYLRKVRGPREPATAGMFWDQVWAAAWARRRWQRWRNPVSAVVQLAVLALLVAALAEPRRSPPAKSLLIVDGAARMNADDVKPSRLAAAKEAAGRLIAAASDYDEMAILSAAQAPTVRAGWTGDKAKLRAALDSIKAGEGGSQMPATVALARRMTAERPGAEIVIFSDACCAGAAELVQPGIEWIRVGTRAGHAAIVRLATRAVPQKRGTVPFSSNENRDSPQAPQWQALVEVRNFSDRGLDARLALALDGKTIDTAAVPLAANGRWEHVFSLPAAAAGRLTARLDPADVLPADNEAAVELSAAASQWLPTDESAMREHDLRAPAGVGVDAGTVVASEPGPPIWLSLAGGALVLCALEWCLYQRRWIS